MQSSAMKIFDCFLFCHEKETMRLRWEILKEQVDKFVIAECSLTFTQKEKPLIFQDYCNEMVQTLRDFEYIEIPPKKTANAVEQEAYQRNYLATELTGLWDDDLILLNDVDEIPNPDCFHKLQYIESVVSLEAYWSKFYLDCECRKHPWPWMKAFPARVLKEKTLNEIRFTDPELWIKKGGWHFQCLGGPEAIAYKCQSFSHAEGCEDKYRKTWTDPGYIKRGLEGLFDDSVQSDIKTIDPVHLIHNYTVLPKYVQKNVAELTKRGLFYGTRQKEVLRTAQART